MSLLKDKRGQARDLFAPIVFIFGFGFLSILGYLLMTEYIGVFTSAGLYTGALKGAGDNFLASIGLLDLVIVLVLVALIIGLAIANFKLAATPFGFIIVFLLAGVYGFVSYFFNFIFIELVSQTVFDTVRGVFPNTLLICTNLHWVMLVNIFIGSITLYAKRPKGQFVE